MSANRENHEMTQSDIAFLLADAADEVEIGTAPVQAVIRGGRRRRARRWAVATATALVVAGTTGALAVTGLPGDGNSGGRQANVAKPPASPEARHVYEPQRTELGRGTYQGKEWHVGVQVWGAPRNAAEADRQFDAMAELGIEPAEAREPADLIGKISYFATRGWGDNRPQQVMFNTVEKFEKFSGTDLQAVATRLGYGGETSGQLVIGIVAKTARQVACHWKDGTTAVAERVDGFSPDDLGLGIRSVDGFQGGNWFVCTTSAGTSYEKAEVTK